MIKSLLYGQAPIAATLAKLSINKEKPPENLTGEQWMGSAQCPWAGVETLLHEATTIFQRQEIPTVGTIFPIIEKLSLPS